MQAGVLLLHATDQCARHAGPLVQGGPDQLVLGGVVGLEAVEMEADVLRHGVGGAGAPGARTAALACSNPRRMRLWMRAISQGSDAWDVLMGVVMATPVYWMTSD